mmetsp:Transcript_21596/g.39494  ORF Transcript_21596/g.39494 Transcript_21596/m.39494 type:complete len:704 (-) Transcript_21596:29-2140(-)
MLSWFKRILFGSGQDMEQLPCTLQQFLYPDNNYKKKCLFIEASVSVSPEAIIVLNKAYTGEQDDIQELRFPIDFSIDLTSYQIVEDEQLIWGFKWRNLCQEGPITALLIGVEFNELDLAQIFKLAACKAIHESSQPSDVPFDESKIGVYCDDEGLEHFDSRAQLTNPLEHNKLVATSVKALASEIPDVQPMVSEHDYTPKESILLYLQNFYTLDQLLFVSAAHLYEHDPKTGGNLLNELNVCFLLVRQKKAVYSIDIVRDTTVYIKYRLTKNFVYHVDIDAKEIMWAEEGDPPRCRLAKLSEEPIHLNDQLMHCIFELSRGSTVEEVMKAEDVKWLSTVNYPVLPEEVKSVEEKSDVSEPDDDADWEVCDSDVVEDDVNTLSAQSVTYDRTFVSRGPVVSIYQETQDSLQRLFEMPALQDLDGIELTPELIQLHNQDRSLLVLSKDRAFVYNVDVERGQVVDEWLTEAKLKVQDIAPVKKYAPQTHEPTFLVVAPKTVGMVDPRVQDNSKLVNSKTYKTNNLFSSVGSSVQGGLAVGSMSGEIRLYKEAGSVAKNLFPGLGEGITSIEVSPSGQWVLATTSNSLLLLPAGNDACSGFNERLGSLKQSPKRLTLKPQDVAKYCLSEINFTPAKFDNCSEWRETSIVTTTGAYMVVWSLKGIAKGNLYDYKVKRLEDNAIDAQFMYGRKDVVVTMPSRVTLQKSK